MIDWKNLNISNAAFFGTRCEISPDSVGLANLLQSVMASDKGCLSRYYKEGYSDTAFEELKKMSQELDGRKVYESTLSGGEDYLYIWNDAILEITSSKSK